MKHLFFTLFSLMVCTMLRAYDAKIDGIYYNFSGNEATVTLRDAWYDSYKGDLIIPESVSYNGKTYSVDRVDSRYLKVVIPKNSGQIGKETVENLKGYAFIQGVILEVEEYETSERYSGT